MLLVPTPCTTPSRWATDCLTELVVSFLPLLSSTSPFSPPLLSFISKLTQYFPDYGNEKEAGEGVARAIKDGLVKREDLFLVSKLWNSFHDGDKVEPICRKQLADWGIDSFDLYIMHFPVALKYVPVETRYPPGWTHTEKEGDVQLSNATIQETWHAMEDLVHKGLASVDRY
jgi:hypothetical protein